MNLSFRVEEISLIDFTILLSRSTGDVLSQEQWLPGRHASVCQPQARLDQRPAGPVDHIVGLHVPHDNYRGNADEHQLAYAARRAFTFAGFLDSKNKLIHSAFHQLSE